jgi:hypothetical protein
MKWKLFLGAVALSFGLGGQSFGHELLGKMLRCHKACAPSCCETTCCEKTSCEPACAPAPVCEPAPVCCDAAPACESACEPACDACDPCCCQRVKIDLFAGVRGLFEEIRCRRMARLACRSTCCEPAPVCCDPAPVCEPVCESACEPVCDPCCRPRLGGLLRNLFKTRHNCCEVATCDSCSTGCDSCSSGHVHEHAPAPAPAAAPEAAPMPPAPMADETASYGAGRVVPVARVVRSY